ncbi:FMN reductase [Intrasporangium oryzae NRRL B-24470]|uniref:FMN reductase n=1 Tax=Intrasporangium oryzae NRRL B-24470 TaxID=1386089 RepID=W9GBT5_9MICO|nr:NAD(P)H-dependent oxidoreductase [Intrasporangium oryzae]EWT03671.1 FMN reductase [Intrasporangium oryzae NRRL B-24470]
MKQLRVIVSSTRPGRIGPKVAEWVAAQASAQATADEWEVKLLDLSAIDLPFFNEEDMPRNGNYAFEHTKAWASEVFESDAIVIVTPQYNRSFPAPIKNAIDYLYAEWQRKPIALVGYGWTGASDATADLAKVLRHVDADVVGETGLVFPEDVSPTGELTVSDAKQAALGELFSALSRAVSGTVDEPVDVAAG